MGFGLFDRLRPINQLRRQVPLQRQPIQQPRLQPRREQAVGDVPPAFTRDGDVPPIGGGTHDGDVPPIGGGTHEGDAPPVRGLTYDGDVPPMGGDTHAVTHHRPAGPVLMRIAKPVEERILPHRHAIWPLDGIVTSARHVASY